LRWRERFLRVCSDRKVVLIPDDAIDLALVTYAAVWKPKSGALSDFPNLEVIFNLGAGVDAVVADLTLPPVPLVRVAVDDLTKRMTEYVVMHVLIHHRRQSYYAESQRAKVWAQKLQWAARDLRDGKLGGPVIINAGRGGLQNEEDLLAALDDGTLLAATLDVFHGEPLPAASPFWSHPRVMLSPHNEADTDPDAISLYVAEQIAR